ncbi:MAG: PPC domain-containing protein, partial [Candidatus Zixiibacteriota bacterium]
MTKKLFVVLVVVSAMLMSFSLVMAAKDAGMRHTPDKYVKTYSSMRNNAASTPMPQPSLTGTLTPLSLFPPLFPPLSTAAAKPEKPEKTVVPHTPPSPGPIRQEGGETCASATVIGSLPFNATGFTCDNVDDYNEVCPYASTGGLDVVYSYTPAANEDVDITLCLAGTDYDTKLYVYENTCASPNYACNDDACPGYISQILGLSLTGGNTYYIVVDGYNAGECGNYEIGVTVAAGPPPNDNCANATPVGEVTDLPFSTSAATFDGGGSCMSSPNIWYLFTSPCTQNVTVSLCGSGYDTKLAVYDGSTCSPLPTEIECNDDFCGVQSEITFSAVQGNQYLIEVGGYSSNTGDGILNINCVEPCDVVCPTEGIP